MSAQKVLFRVVLNSNLLKPDNKIFLSSDLILVQPIILKNETIYLEKKIIKVFLIKQPMIMPN